MAWSWGPTACGQASLWEPLCEIIYIYIELLLRPPWRGLAPPASPTRTSPSSKSRAYNARASLHARWPPPEFSTSPLNPEVCQVSAKAFRGRASRIERDRAHILATGLASRLPGSYGGSFPTHGDGDQLRVRGYMIHGVQVWIEGAPGPKVKTTVVTILPLFYLTTDTHLPIHFEQARWLSNPWPAREPSAS